MKRLEEFQRWWDTNHIMVGFVGLGIIIWTILIFEHKFSKIYHEHYEHQRSN